MQVLCRGFLLYSTFSTGEILSNYSDGNSLPPDYKTFVNTVWYHVLITHYNMRYFDGTNFFFYRAAGSTSPWHC